jgi:hypothetical protein
MEKAADDRQSNRPTHAARAGLAGWGIERLPDEQTVP